MVSHTRDLWPERIAEATQESPASILIEQAALLVEKTERLVAGEVTTATIPPMAPLRRENSLGYLSVIGEFHEVPRDIAPREPRLVHSFYVKAPALDNYRILLLTVMHGHRFYPLALSYMITGEKVGVDSKDDFLHWLGEFLSRQETISLIQALVEQARAVSNTEEAL